MNSKIFVKKFSEIRIKDVPIVGGKNASLGEMYGRLTSKGVSIPDGFATTAYAYRYFLTKTGLGEKIKGVLSGADIKNIRVLNNVGAKIRKLILAEELPAEIKREVTKSYKELCRRYGVKDLDVAVRSSATAEDLPDASFAGQQETFLNIRGVENVLIAVKACIASLFTNRAISYRADKGFDHFSIALSVGIQKMIRSDKASSGVMFSLDTESGFKDVVLINSIYGLGENIVQGRVNPDEFLVFKPTMTVISRKLGTKNLKMVYAKSRGNTVKNIQVPAIKRNLFSISEAQITQLAKWAVIIEKHYGKPMDMEWALDGTSGKLYIIQARPETVQSRRDINFIEQYSLSKPGRIIASGQSVGNKISFGKANRIMDVKDIYNFRPGQVLVTDMTDPDWEPIMKIASAIIADKGGRTCHAAIVSRELGIPCVVGTNSASRIIKTGSLITVDCSKGEDGFVYDGKVPFKKNVVSIKNLKRPKTKIMMNIGEPEMAFSNSFIPNDGIGLARLEFIINNYIKIHPLALINYKELSDKKVKREIDAITAGYKDKKEYFVDKLSQGLAMIAAAFYPKDVIIRLSDFKTNEYANLLGGKMYEPVESNPMIGWRGASRYYSPKFLPAFNLECQAIKRVRDDLKLKNVKILVPFCRTVEEGKMVLEIMKKNGLERGKNGLEVYVMAEIPANIILAEQFCKIFDGFSIGSNDLTQLVLGIDRDAGNSLPVAGISNEKNEAVKTMIKNLISIAKKNKKKVGICGQAPSDFPDFAEFLIECGIDSISLTPDTVISTTIALSQKEKSLRGKGFLSLFF